MTPKEYARRFRQGHMGWRDDCWFGEKGEHLEKTLAVMVDEAVNEALEASAQIVERHRHTRSGWVTDIAKVDVVVSEIRGWRSDTSLPTSAAREGTP